MEKKKPVAKKEPPPLQIGFRRIETRDKERVLRFCAKTWGDWGDYIPYVFDRWVEDPKGIFLAITHKDNVIGFGKVTELAPGELWLEGLRVDKRYRKRGVAWMISERIMQLVLGMKPRAVRYTTGWENEASQHIGSKMGLKVIAKYRELDWEEPLTPRRGRLSWLPTDFKTVKSWLKRSKVPEGPFLAEGWVFKEFTPAVAKKLIAEGNLYEARNRAGEVLGIAAVIVIHRRQWLCLGYLDLPIMYANDAVALLRREVKTRKAKGTMGMLPESELANAVFTAGGGEDEPYPLVLLSWTGETVS